jgi:serine/threonine protein kinase
VSLADEILPNAANQQRPESKGQIPRQVVVKQLLSDGDPEVEARFREEFRLARTLRDHPHIVAYDRIGVLPEGGHYCVMTYLPGGSLQDHLARAKENSSVREALVQGLPGIFDALQYAHQRGIDQRDLKPGNILLDVEGRMQLIDFGLARPMNDDREEAARSAPGAVIGTVGYMSPEQTRGEPVGPKSDQYSMGMVLYQLAAGSLPFPDASPIQWMLWNSSVDYTIPDPRTKNANVPAALAEVINRMVAKDPDDRFPDMDAAGDALRSAIGRGITNGLPKGSITETSMRTMEREVFGATLSEIVRQGREPSSDAGTVYVPLQRKAEERAVLGTTLSEVIRLGREPGTESDTVYQPLPDASISVNAKTSPRTPPVEKTTGELPAAAPPPRLSWWQRAVAKLNGKTSTGN